MEDFIVLQYMLNVGFFMIIAYLMISLRRYEKNDLHIYKELVKIRNDIKNNAKDINTNADNINTNAKNINTNADNINKTIQCSEINSMMLDKILKALNER